jgi:hypothetical protein
MLKDWLVYKNKIDSIKFEVNNKWDWSKSNIYKRYLNSTREIRIFTFRTN